MTLVLDASVAIKLYVAEADSDIALNVVAREEDFIGPDLLFVEVGQALLRHHRERRLSWLQLDVALVDLTRKVRSPVRDATLLRRAVALAQALSHRLHDCFYLALAERIGCELLTADEVLAGKVRRSALSIPVRLLPEERS
jgi:predicted nucleic acid-binding protein